jgi:hypothetical protein
MERTQKKVNARPLTKADLGCALGHSFGARIWELNRTGQETEMIVKKKYKELNQCDKT